MITCTGSCAARTLPHTPTISCSLGAFKVHARRLKVESSTEEAHLPTNTSELHLLQLICLLLRELIFEVDVDKTTPKRCITWCPTGSQQGMGDKLWARPTGGMWGWHRRRRRRSGQLSQKSATPKCSPQHQNAPHLGEKLSSSASQLTCFSAVDSSARSRFWAPLESPPRPRSRELFPIRTAFLQRSTSGAVRAP